MSVLTWTGLGLALACASVGMAHRAARRRFAARLSVAVALSLSISGVSIAVESVRLSLGPILAIAAAGAAMSLFWSMTLVVARRRATLQRCEPGRMTEACIVGSATASVANSIVSAVLLVALLAARCVDVASSWLMPTASTLPLGWHASPLIATATALGLLSSSFLVGLARRGASEPIGSASWSACFWLAVVAATWLALSVPPRGLFHPHAMDTLAPSDAGSSSAMALMAGSWHILTASIVIVTVLADAWSVRRRKWRRVRDDPDALADTPLTRRGVYQGCGIAGLGLVITGAVALTDPQALLLSGRLMLLAQTVTMMISGAAILTLAHRAFTAGLAEIGLALITLGITSLSVACTPGSAPTAAQRYPMVFNAMVVGFGVACWLWTWLANVWEQQLCDGVAWTTAGRLIPFARRFSFLAGCLALFQAGLLALWPRFPSVAAADDSLGRFGAGVGAHLGLALVLSRCARYGRRTQFHVLTVWTVLSLLAFVAARMLEYSASGW